MRSVAIIGTRGYPSFYGGFETAVRKLAPYLASNGWKVVVYGRPGLDQKKGDPDARVESRVTYGIDSKSLSTLSYGWSASRDASMSEFDVVLVMNVANGFFLRKLRNSGCAVIVNVDGIEWDRAKWGRLAKRVFRLGAALTARYADAIVVDSLAIGKRWKDDFGVDGEYIPYGGELVQGLPIESGLEFRGYILLVARFVPENTVAEFFRAVPLLIHDYPVVVVGSSGYGGEFDIKAQELSEKYANFHWLGHVNDDARLHSLWQNAGVYFHGHSVGGTNPALVQAMACGAPVIARNTVYNREVLGADKFLVHNDPASISASLKRVMEDPSLAQSMSDWNSIRASEYYTWDKVCESYSQLLSRVSIVENDA